MRAILFLPKFNVTNSIIAALVKIERRGFLEAAQLSDEWIAKTQAKTLILKAHYTTHIEEHSKLIEMLTWLSYPLILLILLIPVSLTM